MNGKIKRSVVPKLKKREKFLQLDIEYSELSSSR